MEITITYSLIEDFYFWRGKQLHYSFQSKYENLQWKARTKNSKDGLNLYVSNYFPERWEYFMKSKENCFLENLSETTLSCPDSWGSETKV